MRKIRSFTKRSGRITAAQKYALDNLWHKHYVQPVINTKLLVEFIKAKPTILEIGFGNGDSLLKMAISHPELNYLGVEVYNAGIGRLIAGVEKHELQNLYIIKGDAIDVLTEYLPNNSLYGLQLFFPDPWQKRKHHKRRIVQADFFDLIANKLLKNAYLHIVTDWKNYAKHIKLTIKQQNKFVEQKNNFIYTKITEQRPTTKFEKKGLKLQHTIWEFVLTKHS